MHKEKTVIVKNLASTEDIVFSNEDEARVFLRKAVNDGCDLSDVMIIVEGNPIGQTPADFDIEIDPDQEYDVDFWQYARS